MRPKHWLFTIPLRLRSLFRWAQADQELDDELRDHLEQKTEEYRMRGMTQEEAHRHARLDLGGIEQTKEKCRDTRRVSWIHDLVQDLRYGMRLLRKSPGFTAVAVLTLALGIGLNSTIFSLLSGLFLLQPPVRNPEDVVVVSLANPSYGASRISPTPREFAAWRGTVDSLNEIAAAKRDLEVLTGAHEPKRIAVDLVTPNYFQAVGVSPVLGRGFAPAEDAPMQDHEIIISDDLWRKEFGSDPRILGQTIVLSNVSYAATGVMPVDIQYALVPCDAWIPADISALSMNSQERQNRELEVIGRVKDAVPIERVQAEFALAEERFAKENHRENRLTVEVERLREYRTSRNQRIFMPILMALTAIVLLIACVNLAGIFLARCTARRGEFAIRAALGAGRWRTVRQLMMEALLLSALGACAALLASVWGTKVLRSGINVSHGERWVLSRIQVDHTVVLFTFCISMLAVFLFGLAPAIYSSKTDLNSTLKESDQTASLGIRRHRVRDCFVVVQVALAMFLTGTAGTMARNLFQQLLGPRGFEPQGVLTADVSLSNEQYADAAKQVAFFSDAVDRIQGLPGVQFVGATQELPVARKESVPFEVKGQAKPYLHPEQRPLVARYIIFPNYFQVMQIPFLKGRNFLPSDRQGMPDVAVISEMFVKRYFQSADPIAKRVSLFYRGAQATPETVEIVGVVGNVATNPLRQYELQIYVPFLQQPRPEMKLALRTSGDPAHLASAIRESIWSIDKNQPIGNIRTMRQVIWQEMGGDTLLGELLAGMTVLALILATLGIYGVIARMAVERTREIGLRMALGAQKAKIFRMVVVKGMLLTAIGLALGLAVVAPLPHYLFVGSALNGNTLLLMIGPPVILTAALLACYIPARRAMKVDPMIALRYE